MKRSRNQGRIEESSFPRLWILSPTASDALLNGFRATVDEDSWMRGVYFLASYLRTAIVAIHQLPSTPETQGAEDSR